MPSNSRSHSAGTATTGEDQYPHLLSANKRTALSIEHPVWTTSMVDLDATALIAKRLNRRVPFEIGFAAPAGARLNCRPRRDGDAPLAFLSCDFKVEKAPLFSAIPNCSLT